jgi:hypothetical protein
MNTDVVLGQLTMLYIVSFAIQQVTEVLWLFFKPAENWKKLNSAALAVILAILACWLNPSLVLKIGCVVANTLSGKPESCTSGAEALNFIVSVLVIVSGTEGTNSIAKFLVYIKQNQAAREGAKVATAKLEADRT